jgi:MFS family permease
MALGGVTGIGAALYLGVGSSPEYASLLLALPLLGVLIGAVCGGAAGIAGSIYTSRRGRLPHLLLTAAVALAAAAAIGALFTAFSRIGWAYSTAIALPAAVVLGLTLPRVAERFRRPRRPRSEELE